MIKVLIVEDDHSKLDDVRNLLNSLGILGSSIHESTFVKDALEQLQTYHYHLVILDLNLPYYRDSTPISSAGKTILYKLLTDETYITPSEIIGLTSYEELQYEFEEKFKGIAFNLYNYEFDNWREAVENRLMWLKKSLRQEKEGERGENNHREITILVHGVMTEGDWQEKLSHNLEMNGHVVYTYKYRSFSPLKILFPITRERQASHFKKWFDSILIKNPHSTLNIIGHSFGTFLILNAMENTSVNSLVKVRNIVLLGAVIQRTYDFSDLKRKFLVKRIINDCGTNDTPLILSKALCWGLGHAGRVGFSSNAIISNRYFKAGHSIFIEIPDYFENHLVSFLLGGDLVYPEPIVVPHWKTFIDAVIDNLSPISSISIFFIIVFLFVL
ncbi:hypothetical protein ACK33S_03710 [Aeromonas hydrophila]|uniref:hypothetical protein n=1 Tax=Aeromonas hydrophila TaxID=644 RepID=UPI003986C6A7